MPFCEACGSKQVVRQDTNGYWCLDCFEPHSCWYPIPLNTSIASYNLIGSTRAYGIELETSNGNPYNLCGQTVFGSKYDYSVTGMEYISPILYGDEGLDVIADFCEKAAGFQVDGACGYHLHIDMRGETPLQLRHIIYAYAKTRKIWLQLVSEDRISNSYCESYIDYSPQTVKKYKKKIHYFCNRRSRFEWLNLAALQEHGTFEIRLHEGTLDYDTIINWIIAHLRFVDKVRVMSYRQIDSLFDGDIFETLCEIWDSVGDYEISNFYRKKYL